jgi:CheY-like chemotaxis protein
MVLSTSSKIKSIPMHRNLKALIIDDDPFALAMTKMTVSDRIPRKQISIFSCPKFALQYLQTENNEQEKKSGRRGIILTDLEMPDMDGLEFLDEFNQLQKAIREKYRIFVLSSTNENFKIQRLHERPNFEGFIPKPLTVGKLDHLLKQIGSRF